VTPIRPSSEADNLIDAAQQDAGFSKMMKFKKGHYYIEDREVPLGTQMTAHAIGWTKCWVKFKDRTVAERKIYRPARGEEPPAREDLDERDESKWPMSDINRAPQDPWTLQYLLPLETPQGDLVIFVTSSFGGKRGVAELASAYGRRLKRDPSTGQPIVQLRETMMPTKHYGDVPRPQFDIVGWDSVHEAVREVATEKIKDDDMNDEIPF
jgi:hypothetical protein